MFLDFAILGLKTAALLLVGSCDGDFFHAFGAAGAGPDVLGGECYAGDGECFSSILKIAAHGAIGVDFELDAGGLDDAIGISRCDTGD